MPERPNVVVIMADQMKAAARHLDGSRFCETPALESLVRTGATCTTACIPQPLCGPARVSLRAGGWSDAPGTPLNETPMPALVRHVFRLPRHVLRGVGLGLDEVADTLRKVGAAVAGVRRRV